MRLLLPGLVACCLAATPAHAQHKPAAHPPAAHKAPRANGPKAMGKFDDWQAATHEEGGQTACYAFTRALSSSPALPGRGDVVLTVTQRPGSRDVVAISAGFAYAENAEATLDAGDAKLPFYTAGRSAFAKDGHAAVTAMARAPRASAHSPGPRGAQVTDAFSLRGFSSAYAAINKACPK